MGARGSTVHVIATSFEGTREALERATALARGLSARVVLFATRSSWDVQASGESPGNAEALALKRLAEAYTPRPDVLSCVCEHAIDVVQLFQSPGLVVLGGETRWWWPTAEQRLARALARLGCHVTFAHVPNGRFTSPLSRRSPVSGVSAGLSEKALRLSP